MNIDYYALMHHESKYSNQSENKPFPVVFKPEKDGYHWSGNNNRYRDVDLILLYPTSNPAEKSKTRKAETFNRQEWIAKAEWFSPVENRDYLSSDFAYINRDGQKLSLEEAYQLEIQSESISGVVSQS